MDDNLKRLLELQEVDLELRRVEGELKSLPKELAGRDGELKKAREALANNKDNTKKTQSEVNSLDIEIKSREEKITKLEGEANKVRDNAQLMAIQHQIKTLREEIGQFEDKALALFTKIETLEAEGKKCHEDLASAEQEFQRFKKNVETELAAREAEKTQLAAKREGMVPAVNAEVYAKYSRLLVAREGQAIAAVEGQICRGCFMEVVSNDFVKLINGREFVQCRHCNRILYIAAEKN